MLFFLNYVIYKHDLCDLYLMAEKIAEKWARLSWLSLNFSFKFQYSLPNDYFLAPSVLFFSLIWLPWHFLHLVAEIGFLPPHLKHILKNSLRCCAICFFTASVIGI